MSILTELTPDQGIELALKAILDQGYSSKYYESWREEAKEVYETEPEEFENCPLYEIAGAWNVFEEITEVANDPYIAENDLLVSYVGSHFDGPSHDASRYYYVFSVSDSTNQSAIRYFKREGYYNLYHGATLVEGESSEVVPQELTVIDWNEIK